MPTRETVIRPVGDSALLLRTGGGGQAHRLRAALEAAAPAGVRETVVGAGSVLVLIDPLGCDLAAVRRVALGEVGAAEEVAARTVPIPVRYDGEDLAEVAALTGLPEAEVVRRHAATRYTVAFMGFSPGFGYLTGLDPALQVPRRDSPRARVPAGAVAVAGRYTAVYPQATPGGWRLLGHTRLAVFDPARTPPALLTPGDTVRFVPEHGR